MNGCKYETARMCYVQHRSLAVQSPVLARHQHRIVLYFSRALYTGHSRRIRVAMSSVRADGSLQIVSLPDVDYLLEVDGGHLVTLNKQREKHLTVRSVVSNAGPISTALATKQCPLPMLCSNTRSFLSSLIVFSANSWARSWRCLCR